MKNLLSIFCACLLSSCSLVSTHTPGGQGAADGTGEGSNTTDPKSLAVFESTVYAYTLQNCASCHGANQAPLFAVSSTEEAYVLTRKLVDFQNPAASRVVGKSSDSHCGVNCESDGSELTAAIQEWWDKAEKDADPVDATLPPAGTLSALEAYEVSVYAYLQLNCASCHGGAAGPPFARGLEDSYQRVQRFIDAQEVQSSELVEKSMQPHNQCEAPCMTDGTELIEAINYYLASE